MVRTVVPKDYQMGEAAYAAFFHPCQVPFNHLGHEFQMRWVRVGRAVAKVHDSFRIKYPPAEREEAVEFDVAPRPPRAIRGSVTPDERRARKLAYQREWRAARKKREQEK